MPIPAGGIVTAGQLSRMQPVTYLATADTNLVRNNTAAAADISGAAVTLTTTTPNAVYTVTATFDVQIGATGAGNMVGYLFVDGVADSGVSAKRMDAVTRDTISQLWRGNLPAAGSHTFKLQGQTSVATASAGNIFTAGSTKLAVTIAEVV
ncbi:hypothetical protein AB0C48_13865 [Streptomyces sp. NPDC048556]|uniref:hypothetical protein n=1 Tax=Streptomyces sp. NPDC048556 TaxID=3156664 RepID=UPI00341BFD5C